MKKIEVIQTNDGKQFKNLKDAEDYIVDKIKWVFDNKIGGIINNGMLRRHHVVDVINYLISDYESAKILIQELNGTFEELEE